MLYAGVGVELGAFGRANARLPAPRTAIKSRGFYMTGGEYIAGLRDTAAR